MKIDMLFPGSPSHFFKLGNISSVQVCKSHVYKRST